MNFMNSFYSFSSEPSLIDFRSTGSYIGDWEFDKPAFHTIENIRTGEIYEFYE